MQARACDACMHDKAQGPTPTRGYWLWHSMHLNEEENAICIN